MKHWDDVTGQPARVLIVDDERTNRDLLRVMLGSDGLELEEAADGEAALAAAERQAPDLILLDVMMPGMSGYDVAARLKATPATRNIPIIMVTALDDRDSRMRGLEAGAEDFLSKPIDRSELRVRVRNLLRLKAYGDFHDRYSKYLELEVGMRADDLVESNTRFRQLAAAIDEIFFLVDLETSKFVYVSPSFEKVFGRSAESLIVNARSWTGLVHPADRRRVLSEAMPNGQLVQCDVEYRTCRPDGTERAVRTRTFPIHNRSGAVNRFAGIVEDTTDRRMLELQLRQAGKMEAIGQVAASVAHDFNNLLTVIVGSAGLIDADTALSAANREEVAEVLKAARRATDLTAQLLAFSRQQVMAATLVDINDLIENQVGMLKRLLGRSITLELRLAPQLPLTLADRGQIEQVLMNLVVNARDAMSDGGHLLIQTSMTELENSAFHGETVVPGPYLLIAVSDTGSGMSAETQRRLFEPFYTTKAVGRGTGLGLSTTYGIVKQSKGHIWVYSELGIGTTFKVFLPSVPSDAALTVAAPTPVGTVHPITERVLVVDDQPAVRHFAMRVLDSAGYRVLSAGSAAEARELLVRQQVVADLLLTDLVMPGCNGTELFERLHGQTPELKVLYMSGYSEPDLFGLNVQVGASFIPKPFTSNQLLERVRQVLSGSGA